MTLEQRVAVLEEIFVKLQDYYTSAYSGEEIDARLASAGVPIGITKEYKSVAEMNQDFAGTDVQRGQFVLILPDSTASADYGKVYLKGTANWVYAFTLTTLTSIKGPIGPPGKKGDKGDPGEAGSSFAILGYFDTLDDLKAAVPNPKAGDVYGVGTAPPYNIYIWDSVHGKWVGNGNLEGPVGGSSNFVRYDAAQNLTDAQKAQARENIGADTVQGAVLYTPQTLSDKQKAQARGNINAAPGGFGLGGGSKFLTPDDDLNEVWENGSYAWDAPPKNAPTVSGTPISYCSMNVLNKGGDYNTHQIIYTFEGYEIHRYYDGAKKTWSEQAWVNPPMLTSVEYRTTERYLGKPVYVKVVNFGALPATAKKSVAHGIDNLGNVLAYSGAAGYWAWPTVPHVSEIQFTQTDIEITTDADLGKHETSMILRYFKSTD